MTPTEDLLATLLTLAVEQNLRDRAFENCAQWIRDGAAESDGLRGWTAEEIEPRFASCSLVFDHAIQKHPFLDTQLELSVHDDTGVHFRGRKVIGYYRLITSLDGTAVDDYFVIDIEKPPSDQ